MPRGRPKGSKNKSTLAKMNILEAPIAPSCEKVLEEPLPEVVVEPKKDVAPKNSFVCEICRQTVVGIPYSLDFTRLTGKPEYHREARSSRMLVCNKCSKELSDVVDAWLLKKNPGLRKFPVIMLDGETYEKQKER